MRHLKRTMPELQCADRYYHFDIPSYNSLSLGRTTHPFIMVPLHEAIQELLDDDISWQVKLDEALTDDVLPRAYREHPVVVGAGSDEDVYPFRFLSMLCHTAIRTRLSDGGHAAS